MDIRLGLLQVGDIMIGAVNAEVFNPIAQRLEERIALCADHDGDANQRLGPFRLYPARCRLRDVYVRSCLRRACSRDAQSPRLSTESWI